MSVNEEFLETPEQQMIQVCTDIYYECKTIKKLDELTDKALAILQHFQQEQERVINSKLTKVSNNIAYLFVSTSQDIVRAVYEITDKHRPERYRLSKELSKQKELGNSELEEGVKQPPLTKTLPEVAERLYSQNKSKEIHKAKITKVGIVEDGVAKNWEFDCEGIVAGITFNGEKSLFGGYTIEELKKISEEGSKG